MSVDVIKDYLVGLGFNVDLNSFKQMKSKIKETEDNIKEMGNNSSESINKTGLTFNKFKDTFKLPKSKDKFNPMDDEGTEKSKKKLDEFKNSLKEVTKDIKPNDVLGKMFPQLKPQISAISKGVGGIKNAFKGMEKTGGTAAKAFSLTSVTSMLAVAGAITTVVAVGAGLTKFLGGLANEDIQLEKLSRQLWTTKENAMGIDSALKTLGVSMDELYMSPTLLKQFNQLRQDSANMKLPKEYTENLKVVQNTGFEFKRLQQTGSMALKWIGNYILKLIAEPLNNIRKRLNVFNNGFIKAVPTIAKIIGTALGGIIRLILLVLKPVGLIFDGIGFIYKLLVSLFNFIPGPVATILKLIALIGLAIMAGPAGAIILAIALIDDLITAFKGGDSISGKIFSSIKEKGSNMVSSLKDKFSNMKDSFKDYMSDLKSDWDSYLDKATDSLSKIADKAKEVWGKIKEWSKGLWDKAKDTVMDIKSNISNNDSNSPGSPEGDYSYNPAPATYTSTSSSSSTTNNDNSTTNNNTNNITINSNNATEVANKVNSIINTNARNSQGVIK